MKYRVEMYRVPAAEVAFVTIEAKNKNDAYMKAYGLVENVRAGQQEIQWEPDGGAAVYGLTDIEEA